MASSGGASAGLDDVKVGSGCRVDGNVRCHAFHTI